MNPPPGEVTLNTAPSVFWGGGAESGEEYLVGPTFPKRWTNTLGAHGGPSSHSHGPSLCTVCAAYVDDRVENPRWLTLLVYFLVHQF